MTIKTGGLRASFILLGGLGFGIVLSANSDLDNCEQTGIYAIMNSSQPATIANRPTGMTLGRIFVISNYGVVFQTFYNYEGEAYKLFFRSFAQGTKNISWKQVATV